MRIARNKNTVFCLILALVLSACESSCYYRQAVVGQVRMLNDRQPIEQIIATPEAPEDLKHKLHLVLQAREFADKSLHLPVNGNYQTYVDLKRPYAVWVVYAAPEFSLQPKTWYYPVIGRSAYRGYFAEQDAIHYAQKLQDRGLDVYVTGVAAYSTLGWFDDAVLNTIIKRSDTGMVALIFHELAHQLLYISSDSMFNEGFATTVEKEGIRRWLEAQGNPEAFRLYQRHLERREQFIGLVHKHRKHLEALYAMELSNGKKRAAKAVIFEEMRADYQTLKSRWGGYTGYDGWFENSLNNAKLISVATYNDFVPAFMNLLKSNAGDLVVFYEKCRQLADQPEKERHRRLRQMIEQVPTAAIYQKDQNPIN